MSVSTKTGIENIGGALVVILSAAVLFARTLQPTLGGMFNSEEYQFAAYALDLVHPTGYPVFLLLGKLWVSLVPFGDIAFRMNLFSAWWGILAALLTYGIILHLTRNAAAGILGGLIFVTNEFVWRYSSVAEVDTFTAFLAASVLYLLLLWRDKRVPLEVCGLMYGLALVHHRTSLFYLTGIVPFVLLCAPELYRTPRILIRTVLLMLVPLLFYLYVPLRASALGVLGNGEWVMPYILGAASASGNVAGADAWPGRFEFIYRNLLANSMSVLALLLAAFGFIHLRRAELLKADNLATKLLFLVLFVIVTLFTIPYNQPDIDRYLLVPVMIVAIWCGVGVARAFRLIESVVQKPAPRYVSCGLLFLLALILLPVRAGIGNLPLVDFSKNHKVYDFWDEAFNQGLAENGVIIGNWTEMNAMRYMQQVEGRRQDLKVMGTSASGEELTEKLENALRESENVYLTPGDPAAQEEYYYTAVGALVRASHQPILTEPASAMMDDASVSELVLMGHSLNVALEPAQPSAAVAVEPGRTVRLALNWRVDKNVGQEYEFSTTLLDGAGVPLWQKTEPPLRGLYPTLRWRQGEYVTTIHGVYVPPGTPPGEYQIETRLLPTESKQSVAPALRFTGITVTRGADPLVEEIFLRERMAVKLGPLMLIGYNRGREAGRPGSVLHFSLGWQAAQDVSQAYKLRFHFQDASGREWGVIHSPLVRSFPTNRWRKHDAFKEYYTLAVPTDAPIGESQLYVSLEAGEGDAPSDDIRGSAFLFEIKLDSE